MYIPRIIDKYLRDWAADPSHKPLLLRGARQVGKSRAVAHLGESFESYVKIDFERNPEYKDVFMRNRDVSRIVPMLSALSGQPIKPGNTLLFLDEIQECPEAILSLRYFKEDMQELHVIAAGSLLEFALDKLPTFGVARIHSMYMYPLTFDEFLLAEGNQGLYDLRNSGDSSHPLPDSIHGKLVEIFRSYMLVGGMPEVVATWLRTHDYLKCQEIQDDIVVGYEADFPKYRAKVKPELLRNTMRSAALQVSEKFVYSEVRPGWKSAEVKEALDLLYKAGVLVPVTRTDANVLPLGASADDSFRKVMVMDSGLTLRMQNLTLENATASARDILTLPASDLVNKGPLAEMIAGLEMMRYKTPNLRHELYYWARSSKNSQAEVDYVSSTDGAVLPIEVKAGQRGGMKSLWIFMREKKIKRAVRCSLENFGSFSYLDSQEEDVSRDVDICPLYAISMMKKL